MKKIPKIILWSAAIMFLTGIFIFYISKQVTNIKQLPKASNGVFDFTEIDFDQITKIKLHGQVYFYWDTLLNPKDFKNKNKPIPSGLIDIPGKWNDFKINNKTIGPKGYATYRFKIKLPDNRSYGFKIKEFETSHNIYINNKHFNGAGKVGTSKETSKPSWKRKQYYYSAQDSTIEVLLQISNFRHRKGGASEVILFGLSHNIRVFKDQMLSMDMFLFGLLFILFIYHIVLYYHRKKDHSLLYFSLVCLFMLLRLVSTSEKVLLEIFPTLPWAIAIKIEYVSFMAIPPFMVMFIRKFFPKEIPEWFHKLILYICSAFILIVLVTPATVFTFTPLVFQYIIAFAATFLLVKTFVALINNREYAIPVFLGFFLFYFFFINDILYYNKAIENTFLMPLGLFFLVLSQAFALSKKSSKAFSQVENLSERLEQNNNELEEKVFIRTKEILRQKEEIEHQKTELEEKTIQLEKTNNEMQLLGQFKTDMANMMVHDLKTPLHNIIGFSQLKENSQKYIDIIYASASSMQNIIGNILDVEKYKSTNIELHKINVSLFEVANKAFDLSHFLIYEKQIVFENHIPRDLQVNIDPEIIERVIINIFSNATKYDNDKGLIKITANITEDKKFCKLFIYNSGKSIPVDKIDSIFNKYSQVYAQKGDYSYSTGIGLAYCQLMVEAHEGQIGVASGEERGVTFWFTIPL